MKTALTAANPKVRSLSTSAITMLRTKHASYPASCGNSPTPQISNSPIGVCHRVEFMPRAHVDTAPERPRPDGVRVDSAGYVPHGVAGLLPGRGATAPGAHHAAVLHGANSGDAGAVRSVDGCGRY